MKASAAPKKQRGKLKLYGWQTSINQAERGALGDSPWIRQARALVAATSRAEVARLAGAVTPAQLFNLNDCGSPYEEAVCFARPGVILLRPMQGWPALDVLIVRETLERIAPPPTLRKALEVAEARLAAVSAIFNHPNFTDRHGDGEATDRTLAVVREALAANRGER